MRLFFFCKLKKNFPFSDFTLSRIMKEKILERCATSCNYCTKITRLTSTNSACCHQYQPSRSKVKVKWANFIRLTEST